MEKFIIEGLNHLEGSIDVSGSKNAILPVMAATMLTDEPCEIENVPMLSDVLDMARLLEYYGVRVSFENSLKIDASNIGYKPPSKIAEKIRASFLIAGSLLSRFKRADMLMPGGCLIGLRPIDLHLKGFSILGADYSVNKGIVKIKAKSLVGGDIYLDFPSVGATENIILSSVLAQGETTINNCAIEPEIVFLADFLNEMGANIEGAGSEKIVIKGVDKLYGVKKRLIPDRIEAGTYMLAVVGAGGSCKINNVVCDHIKPVILKLREIGAEIKEGEDYVQVSSEGRLPNTDIKTMPYPGFPTDLQPQFTCLMTKGNGTGIVNETIFENRFMYINELKKMGADIILEGRTAIIKGVKNLTGASVRATDLRAGAALIISGLCAKGITEIGEIHYIDRGYENIEKKLRGIGAKIKRIEGTRSE